MRRGLLTRYAGPAIVFSFIMTSLILYATEKVVGLRVEEDEEVQGLDQSMHGETGYYLR